ncbi:MAG: zinc-ribbon domain-containing protein [Clostridiales bacterium]|nr:zinc-ribbon domain-containing protein [Clostridiales bacterium]
MKYCSHCGKEIVDEAVVCPGCGCRVDSTASNGVIEEEDKKVFKLIIKIFMIIGCIATGWSLIPLLWTIPMTVHVFKKFERNEPIGVGFKICTLLFVSLVAGIMLLCLDLDKDL